ncbi:glycosyl hydrolase 108 family protein [Mesorhizobium sp. B1-1-8]|uniref:glycosyl hydrolase 108 family protein n=1 Tax=Mesorhizobium sp. B1-1-8 TaxID=2589976 RepID=UPI0039AEB376
MLKSEGGWSDNPADPGSATMRGVPLATYASLRKLIHKQGRQRLWRVFSRLIRRYGRWKPSRGTSTR